MDLKNIAVIGLIIVAVVLAINAGTKAPVVTTTTGAASNTISVSGSHEMSVDPDKAVLYIAIETTKQTAKAAQLENAEITNAVRDELIGTKKVKGDDIETYSFNLREKYEWDEFKRKNVPVGYTLTHTLKVTTYDIEGTGDLVDKAIKEGANKVDRITFGLKDETQEKYYAEALQEAAKNAESKAKTLASSLKIKLGSISSVAESRVSFIEYDYAPRMFAQAEMAKGGDTEISPQSVQVNANVGVAYNIG